MLENELNDAEPSGEERSGAHSPQINTAEAVGPPPAPVAGDGDAPAAKGRRRATRRPAKASGTDAASPDAPPSAPGVASPGPDAAGPSAIRFASPNAPNSTTAGGRPESGSAEVMEAIDHERRDAVARRTNTTN